jgi:lysyl-tRNA synthetase class II
MMGCYSAYWTYQDHILLAKELIIEMVKTVSEDIKINDRDGIVDFSKE